MSEEKVKVIEALSKLSSTAMVCGVFALFIWTSFVGIRDEKRELKEALDNQTAAVREFTETVAKAVKVYTGE